MILRTGLFAIGLGLMAAIAAAQPASASPDESGRVARLDAPANVVVLEDGRMYRVNSNTLVLVDNQPVPLSYLRPGSPVVIRSGELVTLRDGQYVITAPVAAPVTPAGVPAGPTLKRTIYGKVTDVDNDGEVEIKTDKGSFEIQLTPDTVRYIKKGDTVVIDATFGPPGTSLNR